MGAALIYSNTCDFACCDFQSVSNCQLYFEYFSLEKKKKCTDDNVCKQHVCLE